MTHHYENEEALLNALRELSSAVYDDPGYHTPKNIFNPKIAKSVERSSRSSILPQKPSPPPAEENPYSSIRKTPRHDAEALVTKDESCTETKDLSQSSSTSNLLKLVRTFDTCDYILCGALVCTIIFFLIGICVLLF